MTLEEYYNKFNNYEGFYLDLDSIGILQEELINKLSEKDKNDFYAYLRRPLGIKDGKVFPRPRKTKPKVWKFIYSSLPLYLLFNYPGDKHLRRLYKRYEKKDKTVLKRIEDFE